MPSPSAGSDLYQRPADGDSRGRLGSCGTLGFPVSPGQALDVAGPVATSAGAASHRARTHNKSAVAAVGARVNNYEGSSAKGGLASTFGLSVRP
jgi:hypothetical protein